MSTDEELSSLFQAERAERPLHAAAQHGWQRLSSDLANAVAPMPVAVGPLKLGMWLFPHWILAGFALGVTGAGVVTALMPSVPSQADAVVVRAAHRAPTPVAAITTTPTVALTPSVSRPLARSTPDLAPVAATPSGVALSTAPATFDAELKLITFAKQELDAQRPTQALAWLQEHAQQFPNGVFTTEREALRVLARCARGPKSESLVRAFTALHPGSPLIPRLERACASSAVESPTPAAGSSVDFSKLPNEPGSVGERTSEPSLGAKP